MKQIKCQTCREMKPVTDFYQLNSGRASSHCIACNPDAVLLIKYRKAIRTEGVKAFTQKMFRKSKQLDLMVRAVQESNQQKWEAIRA